MYKTTCNARGRKMKIYSDWYSRHRFVNSLFQVFARSNPLLKMIHVKNLHLHTNSYLTSNMVNLSTPILAISVWQKQWKTWLLLGNSIRNGFKNLDLHPKFFKIISQPNPYLISIFRLCPVNPSTHAFFNTNYTKPIKNLLFFRISLKNGSKNFHLHFYTFDTDLIKWLDRTFP